MAEFTGSTLQPREQFLDNIQRANSVKPQMMHLLSAISVETAGRTVPSDEKIELAVAFGGAFASAGISGKRIAYPSSGLDWRFPVALGGRKVDIIDPRFRDEAERKKLLDDIRTEDPYAYTEGDNVNFLLDVGNGLEEVSLCLASDYLEEYQTQDSIGAVVEYLGWTKNYGFASPVHPAIAAHVENGGLVLNYDFDGEVPENSGIEAIKTKKIGRKKVTLRRVSDIGKFKVWSLEPKKLRGEPIPNANELDWKPKEGYVLINGKQIPRSEF